MKMIKIEISFDSIDDAAVFFAKNVSARQIAAEMKGESISTATPAAITPEVQTAMLRDIAAAKAELPKDEPAAAASSPKPEEFLASGEAVECSYDDLKKSIMKLVAIDPKHMREIADSFGVKTFQGTTADVWPKAKKAVDDKIVELRG